MAEVLQNEGDEPPSTETITIQPKNSEPKHWLEYAGVLFIGLAFFASAISAIFSGWAAWTASDTETRTLRAYVNLAGIEIICPNCKNPNYASPAHGANESGTDFIHIAYKNVGQTPAYNVYTKVNWHWNIPANTVLPPGFAFKDLYPQNYSKEFDTKSIVGKNETNNAEISFAHDIGSFQAAKSGDVTLFIYGHIDYCDSFKKPRTTTFCFRYLPGTPDRFPLCSTHNGEAKGNHTCPEYSG